MIAGHHLPPNQRLPIENRVDYKRMPTTVNHVFPNSNAPRSHRWGAFLRNSSPILLNQLHTHLIFPLFSRLEKAPSFWFQRQTLPTTIFSFQCIFRFLSFSFIHSFSFLKDIEIDSLKDSPLRPRLDLIKWRENIEMVRRPFRLLRNRCFVFTNNLSLSGQDASRNERAEPSADVIEAKIWDFRKCYRLFLRHTYQDKNSLRREKLCSL